MEVLRTRDQLFALEPEWSQLHARAEDASPFQHPAWLLPWWDVFGSGELMTVAVRHEGRLAGLAPMFLHHWDGRRQVTLLGTGVSDRLGFLAEPAARDSLIASVFELLRCERHRWDLCDWQDLPSEFPLPRDAGTGGFVSQDPYGLARLPVELPHGLRRNLRRYKAKLLDTGDLRYESRNEPEALVELHKARWRQRGQPGMLTGASERFLSAASARMAALGWARCYRVLLNGCAIAVLYGFFDGARFWSYQTGFDPGAARFSPGSLVLEYAMNSAMEEGAREFHFLRGDEEYKRAWGAEFRHSVRLKLW